MRYFMLTGFFVSTGFFLIAAGTSASAQPLDSSAPHEQAPQFPWVPGPSRTLTSSAQCGPVVRDGYQSNQVNVDSSRGCNIVGDAANEPSIVSHPGERRMIAIGWRQFNSVTSDFREAGWAYSHDSGHTWVAGSVAPGVFGTDPVLNADTEGVFYFLSIDRTEMRLFKSLDGGLSWGVPTQVVNYFYDKPWITIDHSATIGRNNIYITSPSRQFLRSVDRGASFEEIFPLNPAFDVAGYTLTTNFEGDVLVVGGLSTLAFHKSSDVKQPGVMSPYFEQLVLEFSCTSGVGTQPNGEGLIGQPWVAVDNSSTSTHGNIYLLTLASIDPLEGPGDPGDIVVLRSIDQGVTWSRPIAINDDPLRIHSWQWFNTMSVAPNGRIDVVWNDTRNSQQPNLSELYYSCSNDGGKSWSANVPVSPMFDSWIGRPAGSFNQKLGDYYHMVSDNLGANVAYAATFNGEQDVYFLRIGPWDCNGNEIDDAVDIAAPGSDCNANDVPDECEYRLDVNGDGMTTLSDHAALTPKLSGPAGATPTGCDRLLDADHNAHIDLADFAYLQRVLVSP